MATKHACIPTCDKNNVGVDCVVSRRVGKANLEIRKLSGGDAENGERVVATPCLSSEAHLPLDALRDERAIDAFVELTRERLRKFSSQECGQALLPGFCS